MIFCRCLCHLPQMLFIGEGCLSVGVSLGACRKQQVDDWLALGVRSLNSLSGHASDHAVSFSKPSALQIEALSSLRRAYGQVPPPPVQQTAREAFYEFQGGTPGYGPDVGAMAVFREGRDALPDLGSCPVPLVRELPEVERKYSKTRAV